MTATLSQIRTALAAQLAVDGFQVHAFPPGVPIAPCGVITPAPGQFLTYLTSTDSHDLELLYAVMTQWGEDQSATDFLDACLADSGASSVYALVQADPTLGGVVDSTAVLNAQNYGRHEWGDGTPYLGVEFVIGVLL